MPGVPLDALAQAKRGLRSLFSRGKKKKQPAQPEPTPSSDNAPTQTTTAAAAAAVEVSAPSNRSVTEAEHAPPKEGPPHLPPHPAADPTAPTAASLMPDPPPATTTAPTSSDVSASHPSERQPHISAPSQIEEAKGIDLNPARDTMTEESGGAKTEEASDVKTATQADVKPKPENETGMSATSGPMGDHMAEVWRDSDVGVKEGRPVEFEGKAEGILEGAEKGGKF